MAALQGGRIEAHSAGLGQGSEFIVRLPVAPAARLAPGGQRASGAVEAAS
jgi:signal transduction histidine kinase